MESRATVIMTWAAAGILLATDLLYVLLIGSQPNLPPDSVATVPFVAGYLLLMAALLAAALLRRPSMVRARTVLRAGPAGGLLLLGTLAALSIGLPILVAAALSVVLAVRSLPRPLRWRPVSLGVIAALGAVVLLVGGLELTQRLIVCPAHGTVGGGGSGLISGPYRYECVNGVLSFHNGP
jgi:hypothetical protein